MSRWWTELVGSFGQVLSLGLVAVIMIVAALLVGILWDFFPSWIPTRLPAIFTGRFWRRLFHRGWHWPRLRLPRWRLHWPKLRRRPKKSDAEPVTEAQLDQLLADPDELPDLPIAVYESLADRLAREGRYAEAVRERLRAAVRDLVDHGVVTNLPGWTVTELASVAAKARPDVDPPLREAGGVFSEIWYGERAATSAHDERMRELTSAVHDRLAGGGRL